MDRLARENDAVSEIDLLTRLSAGEGARLLAGLPPYDPDQVVPLTGRLRDAGHSADLVAAALTQSRLRARAAGRFGDEAHRMLFTDAGLQQTTRPVVAAGHAARFVAAGATRIADLGCGLGADSMAFAAAGLGVLAVDLDPVTVVAARHNLAGWPHARVLEADVTAPGLDLTGVDAAFLDPARRTAQGRRVLDPRQAQPPLSFIEELATRLPAVAAKVAPGIPHDLIPSAAGAQWVSVDGDVVEAGLWFGTVRGPADRQALVLRGDERTLLDGPAPDSPPVAGPGEYLLEPDGAVIRAGLVSLVAELAGGWLLDPTIAYVSTDAVPSGTAAAVSTGYRVLDVLPFGLKPLRAYLRARDVGPLTVKRRGTAVEPETLRRQLKLRGTRPATIVLTRVAGRQSVLVVEPLR